MSLFGFDIKRWIVICRFHTESSTSAIADPNFDDVKFLCPVEPLRILSVEHILMNSTTKMFKDIPLNAIVGPNTNGFLTKNIREAVYLPGFGVIVGREASKIVASDAMRYVFGYVPLVKVRPLKFLSNYKKDQIPELYLPIGKSIAHKALIQDSQNINSSLKINGRKFSQTKINIKTIVSNLIEFISKHVTLSSGDMIAVDFSDPIAGQFYSGTHSHGSESIEYDLETIGGLEQISRI